MIRIAGVILPVKKHVDIALTHIYGIGRPTALKICEAIGLTPSTKVSDVSDEMATKLQDAIGKLIVEGDLRREIAIAIKRLRDIKCYRGIRHRRNLPVRGQRTRTNARTRKGKSGKGSVGSKKK